MVSPQPIKATYVVMALLKINLNSLHSAAMRLAQINFLPRPNFLGNALKL